MSSIHRRPRRSRGSVRSLLVVSGVALIVAAAVSTLLVAGHVGAEPGRAPASPGQAVATLSASYEGAEDGVVLAGEEPTPFDTNIPAVGTLQPELLHALQAAYGEASDAGQPFYINSGWRSQAHQQRLLDDAIGIYGSREAALAWVATPSASPHTKGAAADIGPIGPASWLEEHGSSFGLCRIYDNEWWHFELATEPGDSCPARRPSAAALSR